MDFLKSLNKTLLIICGVAAGIGLLTLIWPDVMMFVICYVLAFGLIAVGVLRVMTYIREQKAGTQSKLPNLAIGAGLVLVGLILAINAALLIVVVPFVLTMAIWFAALYLIERTWEAFKAQKKTWYFVAAMALISLVLAVLVTCFLGGNLTNLLIPIGKDSLWLTGLALILCSGCILFNDQVAELNL